MPGCSSVQSNPQGEVPWHDLLQLSSTPVSTDLEFDFSDTNADRSWRSTNFGGEGEVERIEGGVMLPMGSPLTGIHWPQSLPQTVDYQLEVTASRLSGNDFFCGLTFPVGDTHATVVLGGWGGGLCGLSCVDDEDAGTNATRSFQSFTPNVRYTLRLEVRADAIRAWLDGELLFDQPTVGHKISLRTEMFPSQPLGVASFITRAAIHEVRWRPLGSE